MKFSDWIRSRGIQEELENEIRWVFKLPTGDFDLTVLQIRELDEYIGKRNGDLWVFVEGPDKTGKTTFAKKIASELGFTYVKLPLRKYLISETEDLLTRQILHSYSHIEAFSKVNSRYAIFDRSPISTYVYGKLSGIPAYKELAYSQLIYLEDIMEERGLSLPVFVLFLNDPFEDYESEDFYESRFSFTDLRKAFASAIEELDLPHFFRIYRILSTEDIDAMYRLVKEEVGC